MNNNDSQSRSDIYLKWW